MNWQYLSVSLVSSGVRLVGRHMHTADNSESRKSLEAAISLIVGNKRIERGRMDNAC